MARAYPKNYANSEEFKDLVDAFNKERAKKSTKEKPLTALTVRVPDYTKDELEHDAIRAFNGFAGGVHEYRLKLDAAGILVVTEDAGGSSGTAVWERISAKDRIAIYDKLNIAANNRGDPNYVDDVFAQATF